MITCKSAVIIIDMQPMFVEFVLTEERRHMIEFQLKIIQDCKKLGIPIIAMEYVGFRDTIPELKTAIAHTPNSFFLEKEWQDGFYCSELSAALESLGISENLFLMGVNADGCVRATAKTAIENRFQVFTSEHAIAQKHGQDKNLLWYKENAILTDDLSKIV